MSHSVQSWSIIIFCYNEAGNLRSLVDRVQTVVEKIAPQQNEIIIVDDGSSDHTVKIAEECVKMYENIELLVHEQNQGIGEALKTGYRSVQYENVCAIPGDGQFDVSELLPFSEVADNQIISFYREVNLQYSVFRNYLSLVNKKLNKWLLNVEMKDVNWVKIYKREALQSLNLAMTSSLVETEICSKLLIAGHELVEVPSKYMTREYGESKGASLPIVMQAAADLSSLVMEIWRYKRKLKFTPKAFAHSAA